VIINDKVAYNLAFKSTGEMNNALKLARLSDVCGDDCYRAVLSGIHWTIRVYMNQFLCEFENWASRYIQLIPYTSCRDMRQKTRTHTRHNLISLFLQNTVPNLLRIIDESPIIVLSCRKKDAFLYGYQVVEPDK
jgi:hypothetical protein